MYTIGFKTFTKPIVTNLYSIQIILTTHYVLQIGKLRIRLFYLAHKSNVECC